MDYLFNTWISSAKEKTILNTPNQTKRWMRNIPSIITPKRLLTIQQEGKPKTKIEQIDLSLPWSYTKPIQ